MAGLNGKNITVTCLCDWEIDKNKVGQWAVYMYFGCDTLNRLFRGIKIAHATRIYGVAKGWVYI